MRGTAVIAVRSRRGGGGTDARTGPADAAEVTHTVRMSGAPGPDGRHDDLDADELEGLALLVPDDARSLDEDRRAYYLELRTRADGRTRAPRRTLLRRMPAPVLVFVVLAVFALIGSGLAALTPHGGTVGGFSTPLATSPAAAPGQVGGLLPTGTVTINGQRIDTRAMRPAVLALVPDSCGNCAPILFELLKQTSAAGLRLVLVGSSSQTDRLAAFNGDTLEGTALVAVDADGTLASTFDAVGVTAVLVHSDGIVGDIALDLTPNLRLEGALAGLGQPGAPSVKA